MIQFYNLDDAPPEIRDQLQPAVIPLADRPLVMPLPAPPTCHLGGIAHVLERVPIRDLDAWKQRHGLRLVRGADLGQHGVVSVYECMKEGEDDAEI